MFFGIAIIIIIIVVVVAVVIDLISVLLLAFYVRRSDFYHPPTPDSIPLQTVDKIHMGTLMRQNMRVMSIFSPSSFSTDSSAWSLPLPLSPGIRTITPPALHRRGILV